MTRLADLLTVAEAAEYKGVPPDTVRRRIQRGLLPAIKKATVYLIRRKDLDAWTVQRKRRKGEEESETA